MAFHVDRISLVFALTCSVISGPAMAVAPFSVLYHEPLVEIVSAAATSGSSTTAGSDGNEILLFDAFGRRFEIHLTGNHRLNRQRAGRDYKFWRGEIADSPGSWVRLTRRGGALSGMFRDATDVYVIEPRSEILYNLLDPAASEHSLNIIYRLADTVVSPGVFSCGSGPSMAMISGQTAYAQMVTELDEQATALPTAAAFGARRAVTLGALADYELSISLGSSTDLLLMQRFNIVDGLFTEEMDLEIVVDSVTTFQSPSDPFSDSDVGDTLLNEVRSYRSSDPNQRTLGLTHLVTGRNLAGNLSGIAFIGVPGSAGVCTNSGASLTEFVVNTGFSALIIAHELGHNFGSLHDNEAGSPCESAPSGFLMSPTVQFANDKFSACSLDSIRPVLNAANCITAIPYLDLILAPPSEIAGAAQMPVAVGGFFSLTYELVNGGTESANSNTAWFSLPSSIMVIALTVGDRSCTLSPPVCRIDPLAGGAGTTIRATFTTNSVGSFTIDNNILAVGDVDVGNNLQSTQIAVMASPDLRLDIFGDASVNLNETGMATISIRNNSSLPATDVRVDVTTTNGLVIDSLISPGATCSSVSCVTPSLPGQGSFEIDVLFMGDTGGNKSLSARASANESDVTEGDNADQFAISVATPGGDGGSAMHWSVLFALMPFARARRRRRADR